MKNNHPQFKRILALDLHPASFGYAVFDDIELFYWGTKRWNSGDRGRTHLAISRLIEFWDPNQIVVREGASPRQVADIKRVAQRLKVPVMTIRRSLERKVFGASCANRFDRADAIASRYASLQARVPVRRPHWKREPYQIRLFNAIAAGLAYLQDMPGMPSSPAPLTTAPV